MSDQPARKYAKYSDSGAVSGDDKVVTSELKQLTIVEEEALPIDQEIDLFILSKDPLAPVNSKPLETYKSICPRAHMWKTAQNWAIGYFKNCRVRSHIFFEYFQDLTKEKEQRAEYDPYLTEALVTVAQCFKYTPKTGKWAFVPSESLQKLVLIEGKDDEEIRNNLAIRKKSDDEENKKWVPVTEEEKLEEKLKELRARARRIRSRSVDSALDNRPVDFNALKRTPSCTSFKEVEAYAEKKGKAIRSEMAGKKETLESEILDVADLFHGLYIDGKQRQECIERLLRSNLSFKTTRQDEHLEDRHSEFQKLLEFNSLLKYRGVEKNTTSTGSIVLDEFYEFEKFKRKLLRFDRIAVKRLKTNRKQHNKLLIEAYDHVFTYHGVLLEHLLNLVARHIFNPYAVYKAESTLDLEPIQEMLKNVKSQMEMVKNALFNLEPIKRQLAELDQLHANPKITKEEYKRTEATCARYLVERVRAPQSLTNARTAIFSSWLNSTTQFKNSFDIFNFSVLDTFAEDSKCNDEFLTHHFDPVSIAELSSTLMHDKTNNFFEVLLSGFFWQNHNFYIDLDLLMPGTGLDMTMTTFYKHQTFVRLYDLVIRRKTIISPLDLVNCPNASNSMLFSAIIAHSKPEKLLIFNLAGLEMVHCRLGEFSAELPLIEPFHMGTAVAVFKETLCVSVVNELEVPCKEYQFEKTSVVQPDEDHRAVKLNGGAIAHLMAAPDGTLSFAFQSNTQQEKNDRVVLTKMNQKLMEPETEWPALVTGLIAPSFNRLKVLIELKRRGKERVFVTPGTKEWEVAEEDEEWMAQLPGISGNRVIAITPDHPASGELVDIAKTVDGSMFQIANKRK